MDSIQRVNFVNRFIGLFSDFDKTKHLVRTTMKVKFFIHAPSDDSTLSDISTLPTIEWTYPVLPRYKEVVQIEALVGDLQFQNRFENSDKIVDEHFNLSLFCFAVCYINWNVVKGELIPIIHLEVLDDIIERELNELRTTR